MFLVDGATSSRPNYTVADLMQSIFAVGGTVSQATEINDIVPE
jgi:hypothetical protein